MHRSHSARLAGRYRIAVATSLAAALALAVLAATGTLPAVSGAADTPSTLAAVVSSADGTQRVAATDLAVGPLTAGDDAQVTVALDAPRQPLFGVGAALTDASAHLLARLPAAERDDALRTLFAPDRGGLSVVRLVIGSSDFSRSIQSLDDSDEPDPTLAKFSIDHDRAEIIPIARQIMTINPDVRFIASSWSAPGWMKTTNDIIFGLLDPQYEGVYADYLVRFATEYRDAGVPIDRISVQNEPAALSLESPTMTMDTAQQIRVIEAVGARLAAAGLDTRVLVWDHNWCTATPPGGCSAPAPPQAALDILDATDGGYPVAGTALHCYGGNQVAANNGIHDARPGLEIWQTECSGGDWNGTRSQAFTGQATLVLRDYANWASASLLWNLALDPDHGPHTGGCNDCRGVLTVDPATSSWEPNLDFDVLATVARFAPAGSGALTTTLADAPAKLEAAAVCSPDHRAAVTLWNPGAATTVSVRFGASGFSVPLGAGTLTSVRAPEDVDCVVAEPLPLAGPPTTTTTTTAITATSVPGTTIPVPTTAPVPSSNAPATSIGAPATTAPTSGAATPTVPGSASSVEPSTTGGTAVPTPTIAADDAGTATTRPGPSTTAPSGVVAPAAAVRAVPRYTG